MARIPKRWKDSQGRINHTVGTLQDGEDLVVVSKVWFHRRQRYDYFATPANLVTFQIQMNKDLRK